MELRQLETFREIVRQGSFTAAARTLHMTQPAVSAHVKALEVELKARLLDRDGKGVRLTPAGKLVLEAAETALGAVTEVSRRVRESLAPERGRVVLACGDTVALHLLPPVITAFRAAHPQAEVAVQNHGSRAILELVLKREADLGIVTRPPWLDAALWARTLVSDPFVLVVPRGHALEGGVKSLHDLDGQTAVLLGRSTETRGLIDRGLESAGAHLGVALESLNLEVVKAYVASGLGLSILPAMAVTEVDRLRLAVLPLPEGLPPRRITVVRRKDRVPGLLATTLLTLLAKHFRRPGPAGAAIGD
jgi:DNA-binding transcriptional LysR family regulator